MKKIILSLLTISSVIAASTGAPGAYFSASALTTANTFSTGTMSMVLADEVISLNPLSKAEEGVAISRSYGGVNLKPGDELEEQVITVKNTGSIDAHHLNFRIDSSNGDGPGNLAEHIIITELLFGPTKESAVDLRALYLNPDLSDPNYKVTNLDGSKLGTGSQPIDRNADGILTYFEAEAHGDERARIERGAQSAGLDANSEAKLWIKTKIDENLEEQGLTIQGSMRFVLQQDESQQ